MRHDARMARKQQRDESERAGPPPGFSRTGTRALEAAENLIYGAIAVFLVGSACVLLGVAAKTSFGLLSDFSPNPVLEVLDLLPLVLIVAVLPLRRRTP